MKKRILLTAVALGCLSSIAANELPVIWDRNFVPSVAPLGQFFTPRGKCVIRAPSGKYYLAQGGEHSVRVVRLNADGSFDASFTPAVLLQTDSTEVLLWPDVTDLALDAQERVLIAGNFETVNNVARPAVARLNNDGILDETFTPPPTFWYYYGSHRLASLRDGRVLFLNSYYSNESRLVLLNTDGSLDHAFLPAPATTNTQHILVTANSQIIASVGSGMHSVRPLVRLEPNGSVDGTFHRAEFTAPTYRGIEINSATLQPDGKIVVAGRFEFVDGQPRWSIVRLNADGTVDTFFAPNPGAVSHAQPAPIFYATGDSQRRVLLAGVFNQLNGQTAPLDPVTGRVWTIARLNSEGAIDPIFGPFGPSALPPGILSPNEILTGGSLTSISPEPDGKILVAGYITYSEPCYGMCPDDLLARSFVARMYGDLPTNSFEFCTTQFVANETNGTASISVRRLGDVSGSATVDYATSNDSALAGQDYEATSGTLYFAPLESVKSFTVPLLNNELRGRDRMLWLTLTNATGVQVISGSKARLWIAEPFGLRPITWQTGAAKLTVFGSPGSSYVLEYIPWLNASTLWRDVTVITMAHTEESITDTTSRPGETRLSTRFYRLRRVAP